MSDLQFSFTRKQTKTLLKALEEYEESLRAAMPDTCLGAPALSASEHARWKNLEAKQDAVLPFIEILEKRLNEKTPEARAFLVKTEKQGFEQGVNNRSFPSEELPDSLLDQLDELGLSEDAFLDAYGEGFAAGRERFLELNPSGSKKHSAHIDSEEQREAAMQAGMAFGCQGYNDEMGY